MHRTFTLLIATTLLVTHSPLHAGEPALAAIAPTLQTTPPDTCATPCEETAALDGNTVAVSRTTMVAPGGEIVIYSRHDSAWAERTTLANPAPCLVPPPLPDEDPLPCWDPVLGLHMALSGNYLFASVEAFSPAQPRVVYVFRQTDDQWLPQQRIELPAPDLAGAQLQGFRILALEAQGAIVAVSTETTALIEGETRSLGTVHILKRARSGRYLQEARLSPDDALDSNFGAALAVHHHTVVVGAGAAAASTGAAYIYNRVFNRGQAGWRLRQKLSPSLPGVQSFGRAVALSGDTLAVGAPEYFDAQNVRAGFVYIYRKFRGHWFETQLIDDPIRLENPGPPYFRYFGTTLALAGRRLVVGVNNGNPHSFEEPLSLLFERRRHRWQPAARFVPHQQVFRAQISRRTVLLVTSQIRFGNNTHIYDIPDLGEP